MSAEATRPETDSHHIDFDPEVQWPEINQILVRKLRFDIEKSPQLPVEVWLLIFQLATEVPFAFLPRTESPFDLPSHPNPKEMTTELSRSLKAKHHLALVCRSWNEIATPFLYGAVLLRSTRGVTAAWNTFCDSAESDTGVLLGHHVKRIDISLRDLQMYHPGFDRERERMTERISDILQRLPNLSVFSMRTQVYSGDATAFAEALTYTSANTLHTIEWEGINKPCDRFCHSGAPWAKLVSSCPNLKSFDGPACWIFPTALHPDARLSHLSITHDDIEAWEAQPDPPTPLHIRYVSPGGRHITHINTRACFSRAISLDVDFRSQDDLNRLLTQSPNLSQLVLRASWPLMQGLTLDPSITHLGLSVYEKQTTLLYVVKGLGRMADWKIPGVKTLRLMSRHTLLEGENLQMKRVQKALQKIREAGLVLENWEGKPFV
ncbi:hypothetical protein BJ322DRAFT_772676 [Thelephora terrestris]|uniref:F-box domain-containing protein n=1 Tax=Thelephora terrestris TaxID=56493 RepID=A0A9P6HFX7_9AGAM|nr:hypothetical protein BJ322DRAFT_772676 [Thelephora terrestris]